MFDTIRTIKQFRSTEVKWQKLHDANAPKVGDLAPDFELSPTRGDEVLRLSSLHGKPIALIFDNFT